MKRENKFYIIIGLLLLLLVLEFIFLGGLELLFPQRDYLEAEEGNFILKLLPWR